MVKFEITLAFDVPCYATFQVDAKSKADAIKQALEQAPDTSFQPEWDCADPGFRVVNVSEFTA
jgi:hypothetical protein